MTSNVLAALVLLIQFFGLSYADIIVDLSLPEEKSRCQETIVINPGNESSVFATKKVPKGHCTLYFRAEQSKEYDCNKICVTFRKKLFKDCYVKVKFTSVEFDNDGDTTLVYDCWHENAFAKPWCPTTKTLQMDVIENERYHYSYEASEIEGSYEFAVDINPSCSPKKMAGTKTVTDTKRKNEARRKQIKTEGIVVGVCLACIFLVLLAVMYMYYRSKPTEEELEQGESRKGKFLSPFRKKSKRGITISSVNTDTYQEVKQTDDSDSKGNESSPV